MGQKINPVSIRLQLNKNWSSKWIDKKNFSRNLLEDFKIREAILRKLGRSSSVDRIEIKRNAQEVNILVYTAKPGIIIGRSGQGIAELNKFMEKELTILKSKSPLFSRNSPAADKQSKKYKIEIIEIKEPELHAQLIAQTIAQQLEKRIAYRRAVKQAIAKIRQNRRAAGTKIVVSGRLGGVEIARRERFTDGSLPLATFKSNISYALENAYTSYGTIGVKVWIYIKENSPTE